MKLYILCSTCCLIIFGCGRSGGIAGKQMGQSLAAQEASESWQQQMIENNKRMINLTRPKKNDSINYLGNSNEMDSLIQNLRSKKQKEIKNKIEAEADKLIYNEVEKTISIVKPKLVNNSDHLMVAWSVLNSFRDRIKSSDISKSNKKALLNLVGNKENEIKERLTELEKFEDIKNDSTSIP